jgi:hypothetical protein
MVLVRALRKAKSRTRLEFKTMNEKNFKATKEFGCARSPSRSTGRSVRSGCIWLGLSVVFSLR